MNSKKFNEIIERRLDLIEDTLTKKAAEYAINDDRLHNFNKAAAFTSKSREECLWGMALKHLVSVTDIIDKVSVGELPSKHLLDEKIGDLINYLCLLEVSIVEKIENNERVD
jgi:hypothetical protein